MKQTLFLLLILLGGVVLAAYILIFSRQEEIAELTDTTVLEDVSTSTPRLDQELMPTSQGKTVSDFTESTYYTSADGHVTFAYPAHFSVKQVDADCSFCPELVLESGDDRLWFGTQPPGSQNRCEQILQHNEFLGADATTIIWYEYRNTQTEECSQAGNIHGFKATVEVGTTIYYIDYLPTFGDPIDQQTTFLQIARSITLSNKN